MEDIRSWKSEVFFPEDITNSTVISNPYYVGDEIFFLRDKKSNGFHWTHAVLVFIYSMYSHNTCCVLKMEAERSVGNSQRSHNMILSQYLVMIWYYCNMLSITIHIASPPHPHLPSLARDTPLLCWLTSPDSEDREPSIIGWFYSSNCKKIELVFAKCIKNFWYSENNIVFQANYHNIGLTNTTATQVDIQNITLYCFQHVGVQVVYLHFLIIMNNNNLTISVRYLAKIFQWPRWNDTTTKTWHANKSHWIIYLMTVQAW